VDPQAKRLLEAAPLSRLLSIAGHVAGQRWTRVTSQQHGLTAAGVSVLAVLARGVAIPPDDGQPGRATSSELARRCWIRPATLTGVVDTLVRAGFVARARDEGDRRQVWITLTPVGRERVEQIGRQLQHAFTPTSIEQDPAKAAVIREYLIELIAAYHGEEGADDSGGRHHPPAASAPGTTASAPGISPRPPAG
jgi:DNA-binding MarR family transcriptional regulator